ncbi:MAG: enoyl-CoA hydratase-related protein [Candidatus Dormibacteria bacterium]
MNETALVTSEVRGFVALLTLTRPQALNALSRDLMDQLADALAEADLNEGVRAVVITGSERAFCVGADIKELTGLMNARLLDTDGFARRLFDGLSHYRKPVIAAVRGLALGGGCELALACDLVVAGESATFGVPEVTIGVIPGAGGTQRLVHALGKAKAMHLLLTGEPISAQEAGAAGLVARVTSDEECLSTALGIAERIAANGPQAVQMAKDAAGRAYDTSLQQGLEHERRNFYLLLGTSDIREGIAAFSEKRKPVFTGH